MYNRKWKRGTKYAGVYMIKNTDNKKIYIGSSADIENRLADHFKALTKKRHHNKPMQADFDAGHHFVTFVLYAEPVTVRNPALKRGKLYALESKFIKKYDAIRTGYNQLGIDPLYERAYS